ncbi:type IV pilin [Halobaculum lipolyticum]|uniref:Type IV pilin n=1 Tax=Halobaculum lipolyticum TaxID=3032001 RepID=A0ABD5W9N0_9EURY|nr:type IV pilin [Halobaculum sp. DT31]
MRPRAPSLPVADRRATASTVGVALLVAVAVVLSAAVGAVALGVDRPHSPAPTAAVDLTVADGALVFTHRGGAPIDVGRLRVVVAVDGTRLRHQPAVPFFARRGFESGPTGPFNSAADPRWTAGETASFAVAGTNRPRIEPGATVEVSLFVRGSRLATLSASAG